MTELEKLNKKIEKEVKQNAKLVIYKTTIVGVEGNRTKEWYKRFATSKEKKAYEDALFMLAEEYGKTIEIREEIL